MLPLFGVIHQLLPHDPRREGVRQRGKDLHAPVGGLRDWGGVRGHHAAADTAGQQEIV